jgi:hypothetical protein
MVSALSHEIQLLYIADPLVLIMRGLVAQPLFIGCGPCAYTQHK